MIALVLSARPVVDLGLSFTLGNCLFWKKRQRMAVTMRAVSALAAVADTRPRQVRWERER